MDARHSSRASERGKRERFSDRSAGEPKKKCRPVRQPLPKAIAIAGETATLGEDRHHAERGSRIGDIDIKRQNHVSTDWGASKGRVMYPAKTRQ
jgi:hypothetical protein